MRRVAWYVPSGQDSDTYISWERPEKDAVSPIRRRVPYVEMKLEHPELKPSRFGDALFPDAVPYTLDGERRVFYWRPVLRSDTPPVRSWAGVCATTHALTPVTDGASVRPSPWTRNEDGVEVVVDGTVGGSSTAVTLQSYDEPETMITSVDTESVYLRADDTSYEIASETWEEITLPTQSVIPVPDAEETQVTPRLTVRFSGETNLYHPPRSSEYAVFPSFGIDISDIPNPVPVPMENGELDHRALAPALGVDLSDRPYSERVLWQAFAYNAFGPRRGSPPQLAQSDGMFVLKNPR